ncbi:alpha/beta fold hydrolase [Nakamurella deserti]|uniref:alpha/beta fold hydrolase n=1 Tax=Nakamurella deserti TaxID=2164074 RepID=UPI000DBE9B7D|nr:alpha/beta hydrolase [Nakamurella deserti]
MTAVQTHTLDVPGATLTYDVHGEAGGTPLLLVGSPMDARGFAYLAGRFADRTVVTYDPRGTGRSPRTDPGTEATPEDHAADLAAVIDAVAAGPADVFATSGGAINALALVAARPESVRTLVAHEPPLAEVLPDREAALAAIADIGRTYRTSGVGPAMAKFIVLTQWAGPIPDDAAAAPGPDPAAFGLPSTDDGSRDDALLGQNLRTSTGYRPDVDALRAAPTRIVVAAGVESGEQLAARAARALADRLGITATAFPSHHGGFMGPEFGFPSDPDGFAAALRAALD